MFFFFVFSMLFLFRVYDKSEVILKVFDREEDIDIVDELMNKNVFCWK